MSSIDTTKLNPRPVQGYFTGLKEIKVTHITVHMSPEFAHTLNHKAKFADGITDVIWRITTTDRILDLADKAMHGDSEAQRVVTPIILRGNV